MRENTESYAEGKAGAAEEAEEDVVGVVLGEVNGLKADVPLLLGEGCCLRPVVVVVEDAGGVAVAEEGY